jgi:hypothetical protein
MASIVLGAAGSAVGGSLGSSVIGAALGRALGGALDGALFGSGGVTREGPRLEELSVQTSTYGKMIPLVYGSARIAGNIIWARPIKEVAETTETSAGGKGGGGVTSSSTTYSYYASLAIAICEGEVDEVLRVWADSKLLDLSQGTYRIYKGSESQLPDSYIESFEGVGNTPAYRGLSYVVVEDFPLEPFGNRIPNFTFEVKRKSLPVDYEDEAGGKATEEMIHSMIMIPGAGEFVYDDTVQYKLNGDDFGGGFAQTGDQQVVNMHNPDGKANALYALDQLEDTCPNLEWVGVVVTWFGDNMDAGQCTIQPAVEYKDNATTTPDIWQVGSYNRDNARQITIENGTPRYGGTPSDASLLRYLNALKSRGYAPVHLTAMRDILEDVTIQWIRRTRMEGSWRDGVEVPLNEMEESYEIEIFDGSTLVRRLTSTSPSITYMAADQLADFGQIPGSFSVRIYQLSSMIGRGYPAQASFTLPVDEGVTTEDMLALSPDALFDTSDITNLYQDESRSTSVTSVNDPIASLTDLTSHARHLAIASGQTAQRPVWNGEGAEFDGVNDSLFHDWSGTGAQALTQPVTQVVSFTMLSPAGVSERIVTGRAANARHLITRNPSGKLILHAGATIDPDAALNEGASYVVTFEVNGTSSNVWLNGVQIATNEDAGHYALEGVRFAADFTGTGNGHAVIYRYFVKEGTLSSAQRADVEAWADVKGVIA